MLPLIEWATPALSHVAAFAAAVAAAVPAVVVEYEASDALRGEDLTSSLSC